MGCFRDCTPHDLEQIRQALQAPVTVEPDRQILEKLARGETVDLRGRFWGTFADRALKEAFSETQVRVTQPNGTRGYADVVYNHIVLDFKTHDFDGRSLSSPSALNRELDKISDQLSGYVKSPELREARVGVAFFEFRPSDPGRQEHIESYLSERGIGVIWGPEY